MQTKLVGSPDEAAVEAARVIEIAGQNAIRERGRFDLAISGGTTPWKMLENLAGSRLPWSKISLFQVDERVAPSGSPERNLTHIVLTLPLDCQASIRPMPVGSEDLDAACQVYDFSLPERFDLVHLGLGADGHTASLVPDDPVLEVTDRRVAMTETEYEGTRRMTLTYPVIDASRRILFLVTGEGKDEALARLVAGDRSIPAGRIENRETLLITDREIAA